MLPIRRMFKIVNGGTPAALTAYWNGEIPWATPVDLHDSTQTISATRRTLTALGATSGSVIVPEGSILLSTRAPIGYVAISSAPMAFNQGCKALVPKQPVDIRYFAYQLSAATDQLRSQGLGTTFLELSADNLSDMPITIVPLEEQRRIADFLDAETSRIDEMIRLRKQQSELLQTRFRSFQHSQVSGAGYPSDIRQDIDWLGKVPEAWGAPSISRISRFVMGTTFPHRFQGNRVGTYPFIKVSDFAFADEIGKLGDSLNWISKDVAHELRAHIVPPGSILYARVGAAVLLNRWRISTRECVIDDNVRAIHFTTGDPHYWASVMSLLDMKQLINPGPVPSISERQVGSLQVPNPPTALQTEIVKRLTRSRRWLHQIQSRIECQLNLLAERRQALITAAVTGQFDVSSASGRGV